MKSAGLQDIVGVVGREHEDGLVGRAGLRQRGDRLARVAHGDPTLLIQRQLARFLSLRCAAIVPPRLDEAFLARKITIKEAICNDASPNAFGFRVSESGKRSVTQ